MEDILNTEEAAERLGVSARRVQQLIKSGRLPAREFGGSYMIAASDLRLVEDRPPGRPPSKSKANGSATPKKKSALPATPKFGTVETQGKTTRKLDQSVRRDAEKKMGGKKGGRK